MEKGFTFSLYCYIMYNRIELTVNFACHFAEASLLLSVLNLLYKVKGESNRRKTLAFILNGLEVAARKILFACGELRFPN